MMKTDILKTETQLHFLKKTFKKQLEKKLKLTPVSAPLAVIENTGINDDLNGIERCVQFPIKALNDEKAVVVNSLAKWKRHRLKELDFKPNTGIITDMRAIRPDEDYSPIHSIYVDQWDWEKVIEKEDRNLKTLKKTVKKIYKALLKAEKKVEDRFKIKTKLPQEITFIHTEDLLQRYPHLPAKQREDKVAKEYGAVFLIGIGGSLSNGETHDGRAADYDDWSTPTCAKYNGLNGDILVWNPVLQQAFELSSMGIRVDSKTLLQQLEKRDQLYKKDYYFHQLLLNDLLMPSMGGGIGQSRVAMFLLNKKHIGEVQSSIWSPKVRTALQAQNIFLL
ncbi:aspartate--ammonia ligase [Mesonia sp. HuA40]|uniref:aspartate--ammonia ligase n=1 Tax=Mesonia sp. HuA40 TaxID=2602761 RepID=UPI0011C88DBD|nr:aspartate--ammonia ligase [Mesonia sp. HuA40]TXK71032.1 aspartate--ammonia ligase [Mesonia sp. HuA40]